MATIQIVPAQPAQAEALAAIALAAKSVWGYPQEQLAAWAAIPIISAAEIARDAVWIAERDGVACGWMRILFPQPDLAFLEDLWVSPTTMGQGIGRRLFAHATELARTRGAQRLVIDSDPNAQGFYERMGAILSGSTQSSWGRMIPVLTLDLSAPSLTTPD